jgi:integrase
MHYRKENIMATAKKLPSGSWRCRIYVGKENGKDIYKSFTASTKKEAEFMATQYLMDSKEKKSRKSEKLFSEELDIYISTKEAVLSPATIRGYRNIERILNKNYPDFFNMKISDIEQEHVQRIVSDLAKTKSPKTVRNYHGLISAVIGSNLNLNTTMPQKVQPELYIPSDDEIKALVIAVKDTELEIPVLLGAFCMMRRGEICGLDMKKDINGNTIHVHHSLVLGPDKQWHLKAPKTTTSDRYIEAPQFVIDRIKEVGHITNLNPHSISIMFQRVLERNNIPHFRFHDLRHYSASIRHALGIPDAYIMADGGWCSDKVLKAVYRHAMSDRKKEMSDKANSHFSSLF